MYYCCYCKCLVFLFRSFHHAASSEEDPEEWRPPDCKHKAPTKPVGDSAAVKVRAPAKRTAKPKEPKQPRQPKTSKVPKEPKLEVPRRATVRKTQAPKVVKDSGSELYRVDSPKMETAEENVPTIRMKEEVRELFFFLFLLYNTSAVKITVLHTSQFSLVTCFFFLSLLNFRGCHFMWPKPQGRTMPVKDLPNLGCNQRRRKRKILPLMSSVTRSRRPAAPARGDP